MSYKSQAVKCKHLLIWGNWIQGLKSYQWWMMQSELVPPRIWTAGPNPATATSTVLSSISCIYSGRSLCSWVVQLKRFFSFLDFLRIIFQELWDQDNILTSNCAVLWRVILIISGILGCIVQNYKIYFKVFFNNILLFASELLTISNN